MTETWTLPGQIARLAVERPDRKALVEMGPDGGWVSTSWGEYWQAVRDLAKGLISLGMQTYSPYSLTLNLILIGLAGLFAWRVNKSLILFGWL